MGVHRLTGCARSLWMMQPPPHAVSQRGMSLLRQPRGHAMMPRAGARSGGVLSAPPRLPRLPNLMNLQELQSTIVDSTDLSDLEMRNVKGISYVSRRRLDDADFDANAVDEDGLPLVYNEERISAYWGDKPGELASRWARFAGISAPWLTALASAVVQGKLEERQAELARTAVSNLERLGPTFIKLGQILSIRPDILPPVVMKELAALQDRIAPFDTALARAMVEKELGAPIDELFSEFSAEPVAAASLAQVYRARVRTTGEEVAVKVQRPAALGIVSKDLYVLRRAVRVYEGLVKRFTAQTTDYQVLLSTFAEGLYTEMDFRNEALNSQRMQALLDNSEFRVGQDIVIPKPLMHMTTRQVLTMEWITGVKLTTLPPAEIRQLASVGQTAFLTQLLEIGFFHGDPHPGNLLKVTEGPNAGKLALLDFGLVAEIPKPDREAMVSATVHLANRDWDALIDDFIALKFLPLGCDRGRIVPVMERVLGPYLRGGGAKAFNFSALSQDLLSVTMEIPFSVPPYMSLLARSVATLEGIALLGDPNYQMVTQAYPFVVRKVLRNNSAGAGSLLREIVYDAAGNVKPTRLSALLNAALGYAADSAAGFVDLDAAPSEGASTQEIIGFLMSPEARDLRPVLVAQLANAADLVFRDRLRKAYALLPSLVPRLPFFNIALPVLALPPVPVPGLGLQSVESLVARLAPGLSQEEGIYLQSILQLAAGVLGVQVGDLESPSVGRILQLLRNPTEQLVDASGVFTRLASDSAGAQVAGEMVAAATEQFLARQAQRLSLPVDIVFPFLPTLRRALASAAAAAPSGPMLPLPQASAPSTASPQWATPASGALPGTNSSGWRTANVATTSSGSGMGGYLSATAAPYVSPSVGGGAAGGAGAARQGGANRGNSGGGEVLGVPEADVGGSSSKGSSSSSRRSAARGIKMVAPRQSAAALAAAAALQLELSAQA